MVGAVITTSDGDPLYGYGDFSVRGDTGNMFSMDDTVGLCGCELAEHKQFCVRTHKTTVCQSKYRGPLAEPSCSCQG